MYNVETTHKFCGLCGREMRKRSSINGRWWFWSCPRYRWWWPVGTEHDNEYLYDKPTPYDIRTGRKN